MTPLRIPLSGSGTSSIAHVLRHGPLRVPPQRVIELISKLERDVRGDHGPRHEDRLRHFPDGAEKVQRKPVSSVRHARGIRQHADKHGRIENATIAVVVWLAHATERTPSAVTRES